MSDIIGVSKKYTNGIVLPGPSKRGPILNPIVVDRWMELRPTQYRLCGTGQSKRRGRDGLVLS